MGGLVGRNNGEIENAYASGKASAPGLSGSVVGIVVEGVQTSTFAPMDGAAPYGARQVNLNQLTGDTSGWAPSRLPQTNHSSFFCDTNVNGYIDPSEHQADNYVWRFTTENAPVLRCVKSSQKYFYEEH